ncbi:MAG: SUF system Fe-S cluster assembly protein [Dichotomicrobium sp.]
MNEWISEPAEADAKQPEETETPATSTEAQETASAETGGEQSSAIPQEELERMSADIIASLKTVYDPEIPVDIYELGLIYRVEIEDDRMVKVLMTLTAPGCPVAGEMPIWVENAVSAVPGVSGAKVELTFDPPWDMSRMSEEAQMTLGIF